MIIPVLLPLVALREDRVSHPSPKAIAAREIAVFREKYNEWNVRVKKWGLQRIT